MVIYVDIEATKNNEMVEVDGREKGSKLDTESSLRIQQESDDPESNHGGIRAPNSC